MPVIIGHDDPALPWLDEALDPVRAGPAIVEAVAAREDIPGNARLLTATLQRHKHGRRALIRYHLADTRTGWSRVALGKTRAKGLDHRTAALVDRLATTPLGPRGDAIGAVPATLGLVPKYHLWLQTEVVGRPGFVALAGRDGPDAARRIGVALAQLHLVDATTDRRHALTDELATLERRFETFAANLPPLASRARRVLDRLRRQGDSIPAPTRVGLHRDFYPDQVRVGNRVYLLDLDLYAEGDPALDLGNFTAHLIEFDRRTARRTQPLAALTGQFLDGYASVRTPPPDAALRYHETLALARHVALSATIAGREHTTDQLLRECEERVEEG